jgi:hypothetical protein
MRQNEKTAYAKPVIEIMVMEEAILTGSNGIKGKLNPYDHGETYKSSSRRNQL